MAFDSLEYFAFLAAVVLVFRRAQGRPGSMLPGLLLFASLLFYAAAGWAALGLFLASIIVNQRLMESMARSGPEERRALLAAGIAYNLLYLFAFKYAAFFYGLAGGLGSWTGWWQPGRAYFEVLMPIGVSFYTFESLSLLYDVHKDRYAPPSLPEHALFVSFFPHLIAGPILRGGELLPQIKALRSGQSPMLVSRAVAFLSLGCFKKLVLADTLGAAADPVFDAPFGHGALQAWLALYAFAFQIYFDFSGYSDMAEGSAALFGLRLAPNFRGPYSAVSLSDFWRRWHMTLSSWLRDHLYIPLGGSRFGAARAYAALFVTMLLGGLWHGANATFLVWGAYHGVLLSVERALGWAKPAAGLVWRRLAVFHAVLFGWSVFRAPDLAGWTAWAGAAWGGSWRIGPNDAALAGLLGLAWAFSRWESAWESEAWARAEHGMDGLRLALLQAPSLLFALAHSSAARPFIYFRF